MGHRSYEILNNRQWDQDGGNRRFLSIPETYQKFSLAMAMAMMYPNPAKDKKRILYLGLISSSFVPAYVMWFYDASLCIQRKDLDNLTRQISLGVPIMFCQIKMILIYILRKQMKELFDEVNADYERCNNLPEEYQIMTEENRRTLLKLEKIWICVVFMTCGAFPTMATVLTIYHHMFKESQKFMIHDMNIPFLGELRYESPYFEIFFVYMLYIAFILAISYVSYDGMFFVHMLHACLKMNLICCTISKAFTDARDVSVIRRNVAMIVEEQRSVFRFIDLIKEEYEMWLALVFGLTVIQLCVVMFQVITSSGSSIDPRYIIFMVAAVLHIYVPCYLVSRLSAAAVEVADAAYCCGWERSTDRGLRRSVCIIIAQAQKPLQIKALNMITFNMELFVSVMQTSYSVFTLLRK